jgi:transposase
LGRNIMRVYNLKQERVRLDTTTVSGHHAGGDDSLFQFGHSKDDPTLSQVKVMVAALDPLGLPVATQVVAAVVILANGQWDSAISPAKSANP